MEYTETPLKTSFSWLSTYELETIRIPALIGIIVSLSASKMLMSVDRVLMAYNGCLD